MQKYRTPSTALLMRIHRKRLQKWRLFTEARDSERRFREAIHFLPIPIGIADRQGRVLAHNQMFTDVFGYTIQDIPTIEDWLKLAYPNESYRQQAITIWQEDVELALGRGMHTPARIYQVTCKDGSSRLVEIITQPVGDLLVTIFNDVTAQKQAEESQRLFKSLVENASDAIGMSTPEGKHYYQNQAFSRLFGEIGEYPPDTLYVDRKVGQQVFATIMAGGQWVGEVKMYDRNKNILDIFLRAYPNIDENGKIISLVGIHTDITARKRPETALRSSLERNRAILTAQPDLWFVIDANGVFRDAIASDPSRFLMPPEQFIGHSIEKVLPPYLAKLTAEKISATLSTGQIQIYDYSLGMGGEEKFFESRMTILNQDSLLVLVRDVTDRKRAEEALKASARRAQLQRNALAQLTLNESINQSDLEESLKDIARIVSDVLNVGRASIWLLSADNSELKCVVLRQAGQPPRPGQEILNAANYPVYFQALRQESILSISDTYLDPRTIEFINDYLPRFGIGALLDVSIQNEGRLTGIICAEHTGGPRAWHPDESLFLRAVANFTAQLFAQAERKRAEDELRESEKRFRVLFENAGVGVAQGDTNTRRFIKVNQKYCEILGYTRQEMESLDFAKITYPEDLPKNLDLLEKLKRGEIREFTMEKRYIRKNGSVVWVLLTVSPLWNPGEPPSTHITVVHDITEQKRAEYSLRYSEAQIRKLNAELEQRVAERTLQLQIANKELEAFAYSVSHDLRAPLRAIDGFSRILVNEYAAELSAEARELLDKVRSANENMSQLVDALLGLSRMTRAEIRRERIDLSPLAREILANLARQHPERDVIWVVAEQVKAHGDFRLLRIVLENLLGNAWKFTSKTRQARIEFGIEKRNDETIYFVRDNGAGFNPRYADKLFGAFQRLHSANEFEGTGIGLATVQRIIHRHGGRIWAHAEVGKGATFYFTLG